MRSEADASPLMRQYREIKRGYPDAILLFRVGDFYEMFYEDAQIASKLLSIALTSRDKSSANPVPLCGVPYHAAQGYIAKLLKAGRTVALCEQVEDPKLAKGLVRREVVRLYTPGTLVDTEFLSPGQSHFLVAVAFSDAIPSCAKGQSVIGLACVDVSTGEFWMTEFQGAQAEIQLMDELARLEPRELLHPDSDANARSCLAHLRGSRLCAQPSAAFDPKAAAQLLQTQFAVHSLDGLGCSGLNAGIGASGAVLRYLRETQPTASFAHLRRLQTRWSSQAAARRAGRHGAGAVTRARQAAAKAARSATSRPLAANSSANRRGYRRVVFRAPWHTTVCGSAPAIASRRTVSREIPSRCASCAAVRKSAVSSVSGGAGARGGGMSAAARARATASSSSGGTGGRVSWWVFRVLGCMVGSCRRALPPG